MAEDCLFCKIGAGSIPAPHVHDDTLCFAIADIAPKAPVHLLIIPREHLSGISALDAAHEALGGHLLRVADGLARQKGLDKNGFRLVFNSGADAGQTVFHLHLHLLGGQALGEMNSQVDKTPVK